MQSQKKFILIIVSIISLLAIKGGIGYYLRPEKEIRQNQQRRAEWQNGQPEITLGDNIQKEAWNTLREGTWGWRTYRNEKYGFEFKYPPSLKFEGNDEELVGSYAGNSVNISIIIMPLREFPVLHPDWNKWTPREKMVDHVNVIEYYNPTEEGSINDRRFVYIPLTDQRQIELYAEIGFADATDNFNKILSAFRFME